MKSLSSFNQTAIDNPHVDIIRRAKIEFSGLALYLCDRTWGDPGSECVFNGQIHEPLIISWGTIRCGRINPVTYEVDPGEADFTIDGNTPVGGAANFAGLFALYDPHYVTVTISEIHNGASAAGDLIDIFKGKIEDFPEMTTGQATVACSGLELDIANKFSHTIINTTTYPGADPDDVGKMLPEVWGQAKKVPFMAVDAGWITTLAQDLAKAATGNVNFTDVSGLPSSGTIQIDAEQMTYSSKSDANNTLNISARGQNSTTDVDHDLGATTAEIQTEYFYIMGHAVKAIDAVYVQAGDGTWVKQPAANHTAYTGQSGDEHASYPGKAVIKFTTLPVLKRQVNVAVSDAITVDDNIGYTSAGSSKEMYPNWCETAQNCANAYDGNENTYATIVYTGTWCPWTCPSTSYGTITGQYFWLLIETNASSDATIETSDGVSLGTVPSSTTKSWFRFYRAGGAWSRGVKIYVESGGVTKVYEIKKIVEYTPTLSKSGGAYRGGAAILIGNSVADTVIGGRVAADIDGYQDDASGTYTGTPDALIERPDHLLKHILIAKCGLTASEIDSTTYTAAGAFYDTNSYAEAVVVLENPNTRMLINQIAHQAKSIEFWEAGVHHLVHIPASESTDKTLDQHRIDLNRINVRYTNRIDLKNTFSATYARDWSGYQNPKEADRAVVTAVDSGSVTKYGTLEGKQLAFPFIVNSTQAQAVLDWTKNDRAAARLLIDLTGGYYLTDIERGDIITFILMEE